MAAKTLDLYIEQGATYEFDFTWADTVVAADGTKTMVPKDITGCTARMQIRAGYCRPVILEATTTGGFGDLASFRASFHQPPAQLAFRIWRDGNRIGTLVIP